MDRYELRRSYELLLIMRLDILLTMTVLCNAAIIHTNRHKGCVTHVSLRDKWRFLHHGRRPFIRVRRGAFIFRNGKYRVRLKCVESFGSIYLLRKSNYNEGEDAVVCLGFIYIADHTFAEYSAIRLMGPGIGSHIMSPRLVPHGQHISINSTCDLADPGNPDLTHGHDRRPYAFIKRAAPGCKFPKELSGRWNFTYLHARSLDIAVKNLIINLLDGTRLVFSCESRDSRKYLLRSRWYPTPEQDAFLCVQFVKVVDDPFYSFVFSRLNSGNYMDGMLRLVRQGQPVHMHQHCDWLDSPAAPEFMYP